LNQPPEPVLDAFLLASGARILYPIVCFACDRAHGLRKSRSGRWLRLCVRSEKRMPL